MNFEEVKLQIENNPNLYDFNCKNSDLALGENKITFTEYFDLYDLIISGLYKKNSGVHINKRTGIKKKIISGFRDNLFRYRSVLGRLPRRRCEYNLYQGDTTLCTIYSLVNAIDIIQNGFNLTGAKRLENKLGIISSIIRDDDMRRRDNVIYTYCHGYSYISNISVIKFLKGLYLNAGVGIVTIYKTRNMSHAVVAYIRGGDDFNIWCVDSLEGGNKRNELGHTILDPYMFTDDMLANGLNHFDILLRTGTEL